MTDIIEKTIDLAAPRQRVWRALTDVEEFGRWFRVALDGPFVLGGTTCGHITYPGYEHLRWEAVVMVMDEPSHFAFTWHPFAVDPQVDYSAEESTTVAFRLTPSERGTRLTVTETGFDRLPPHRRDEAWRMNDRGWTTQIENIRAHVEG